MSGFTDRMQRAVEHETFVQLRLQTLGWDAEKFGQGQLTEPMRALLRDYRTDSGDPTPMRWMPDILAGARRPDGRSVVRLIDAKAGDGWHRYGNHDVEADALSAAVAWSRMFRVSVWFVFEDFSCISAEDLDAMPVVKASEKRPGARWPGSWHGAGSGTPFWLFRASDAAPLDREFPSNYERGY